METHAIGSDLGKRFFTRLFLNSTRDIVCSQLLTYTANVRQVLSIYYQTEACNERCTQIEHASSNRLNAGGNLICSCSHCEHRFGRIRRRSSFRKETRDVSRGCVPNGVLLQQHVTLIVKDGIERQTVKRSIWHHDHVGG